MKIKRDRKIIEGTTLFCLSMLLSCLQWTINYYIYIYIYIYCSFSEVNNNNNGMKSSKNNLFDFERIWSYPFMSWLSSTISLCLF